MTDATERLTDALADPYRLQRKLGEGGMASVYLAEDIKHERQVAIKILPIVSEHPGAAQQPWWSDDGRTLYYQTADTIWAAGIEADPAPRVVSRRPLFADSSRFFHDFRNGRFLGTEAVEGGSASGEKDEPTRHVVIHHWFTELERIFEGGR